jgi:amino-acid N-acetyltransferase
MQATSAAPVVGARPEDFGAIVALLKQCGLPADDLSAAQTGDFVVAEEAGRIVGTAALQRFGDDGLLRSLAVAEPWRGRGLGAALVEAIEQRARSSRLHMLWLLTTTAAGYFAARGWRPASREAAPAPMRAASQFAAVCPASAVCMTRSLL